MTTRPAAYTARANSSADEGPIAAAMHDPVPGKVTSPFGWRRDPFTGHARFHKGVDLRAAYGQDVQSAAGGRVVFSGEQSGYGLNVVVEHADGTRTRYAHLSAALVAKDQPVRAGESVGRVGSSGRSTGPHLHFEVIDADGRVRDPRHTEPRPARVARGGGDPPGQV